MHVDNANILRYMQTYSDTCKHTDTSAEMAEDNETTARVSLPHLLRFDSTASHFLLVRFRV